MVRYSDTDIPKGSVNSLWLHLTPPRQISTLQLKSRHSCSSSSFLLENLAVWSNEPTAQNNCERVSLLSRRKSWVFEDDHEDEDENDFQTCLNFGFRVKPPPARAGAEP
jgi:hypothetical protein